MTSFYGPGADQIGVSAVKVKESQIFQFHYLLIPEQMLLYQFFVRKEDGIF